MPASLQKAIRVLIAAFVWCTVASAPFAAKAHAAEAEVLAFAAASTTNALTEIAALYTAAGHGKVALSFGSSSTLAKQIESGAPADIFLSANANWMDYLEGKQLLEKGSRADLLGNRIVLIVPTASTAQPVAIDRGFDFSVLLGKDGLLAVGDPAHVPVGTYSKEALQKLGLWEQVAHRLAPAKDVRAGLALVERGEAPVGIVYASDAVVTDKVRVIGMLPEASHAKIDYPVAVIGTGKVAAARQFVAFLSTPEARDIWKKYGFELR